MVLNMSEFWYAIKVEEGSVEGGYRNLNNLGVNVFLPYMEKLLRRQGVFNLVSVPLFNNYLFAKSNEDLPMFQAKISIYYKEIVQLSMTEQLILFRLMDENFIIHQSTGLIKDGKTIVEQGPLQGLESEIKKIDRHKRFAYMKQDIAGLPLKLGLEITTKT